jgi:adenine phosphoribosyltransferase
MIKESIPNIPNWPIEGVVYRDITGLVSNPQAFKLSVDLISDFVLQSQCDYIIAPDARGFIWSSAVAYKLGLPMQLVRKPGKLPPPTHSYEFDYEYAKTSLHIKADSNLNKNSNVVIIDDVNATGGTALAIVELLKNFDVTNVSYACVVDLPFLNGSAKLQQQGINFFTTVTYDE